MAQIEDRLIAGYEKKFAKKIRSALKRQGESFIENGDIDNSMRDSLEGMFDEVSRFFLPRQWMQLERNVVKIAGTTGFFRDEWEIWIEVFKTVQLAQKVVRIDETTRNILRDIVETGSREGLTFNDIRKRIVQVTAGAIGRKRAMVISRTEVGNAVNEAKTRSADDWAQQTGRQLGKLWIHRGAKDPRDWHISLDNGVAIPKQDRWMVTDPNTGVTDMMMYPHDYNASAGNVINCGCHVIYTRMDNL